MVKKLVHWFPSIVGMTFAIIAFFLAREFAEKDDFEKRLIELEKQEAVDKEFQKWTKEILIEIKMDVKELKQ